MLMPIRSRLPHAKFHGGQTLPMSVLLGVMTLVFAWRKTRDRTSAVIGASGFSAPYCTRSESHCRAILKSSVLRWLLCALLVLLPYLLIDLKHYSATQAGAALLPMPIVIALTAPTMGRLAAKIGAKLPLTIGPAVVALAFLLATRIPSGTSYWTSTLPSMCLMALGMAGAVAPLTTAVLAAVQPSHSGVAAGLNSALARTGGLVATALASAVLVSHGTMLASTFKWAMVLGAATAIAGGACAFIWLGKKSP